MINLFLPMVLQNQLAVQAFLLKYLEEVSLISENVQEPHAWATILWDNAFAEWGRQPFVVPEKVPWLQVDRQIERNK